MKSIVYVLIVLTLIVPVYGSFIESLNCDDLFSDTFTPQRIFNEPAEVCFYGSGYDTDSVSVNLENTDNSYSVAVPVTHSIVTSVSGKYFSGIQAGEYEFSVTYGEGQVINVETVVVLGDEDPNNETEEPVEQPVDEIPEFSTIFAAVILAGAGLYIKARRKYIIK